MLMMILRHCCLFSSHSHFTRQRHTKTCADTSVEETHTRQLTFARRDERVCSKQTLAFTFCGETAANILVCTKATAKKKTANVGSTMLQQSCVLGVRIYAFYTPRPSLLLPPPSLPSLKCSIINFCLFWFGFRETISYTKT